MKSVGDAKAALLHTIRRGGTTVLIPADSFGVGNLLYFWLQASARRGRGEAVSVRWTDRMQPWGAWFPRIFDELLVSNADMSFLSRREVGRVYQEFGREFTREDVATFIEAFVMGAGSPFARLASATSTGADLTINVRRGDYYSIPKFRGRYSFDVVEYVGVALEAARARAPVETILIVSDDPEWCRVKLARLGREAELRYPDAGTPVPQQLALLAASPRLILSNSTFSYWGAYLSNHLHRTNHAEVYAPWFHSREWDDGAASQLDARWSIIRDVPGGWDG